MRNLPEYEVDSDFAEYVIESFVQGLEEAGIEMDTRPVKLMNGKTRHDPVVYWSGFWSQGDGACFAGYVRDIAKWCASVGYSARETRHIVRLFNLGHVTMRAKPGYRHPNQHVEFEGPWIEKRHKLVGKLLCKLESDWESFCEDRAHKLYRSLEREYEHQQAYGTLRMRRESMAEARQAVRDAIQELRTMGELGLVNPGEYGDAEESLADAWLAYREAAEAAFEAYSHAHRHGIDWRDCSP